MGSATLGLQALTEMDAKGSVSLATAGNTPNDNRKEKFISISRETVGSNKYFFKIS